MNRLKPLKRFSQLVLSRTLKDNLKPFNQRMLSHKIYTSINDFEDLKTFMENHCFAVWDFMSLLKTLQQSLTCVSVPWVPRKNCKIANFINQIVLEEESDDLGTKDPNNAVSHYELYMKSMKELNADPSAVQYLVSQIGRGTYWRDALKNTQAKFPEIPESTFSFVNFTLDVCESGKIHEVAGSFLFGREDPIPQMFSNITHHFDEKNMDCKNFRTYLDRHIQIDSANHSVLAEKLLFELCGDEATKWGEVETFAVASIKQRISLWDGVVERIEKKRKKRQNEVFNKL